MISEAEWANEIWSKAYSAVYHSSINPSRVSFDSEDTEHVVTKYAEMRTPTLFITRDEIERSATESDRECNTFLKNIDATQWKAVTEAIKNYNQWLLDSKATKIARGEYKGRLGLVESITASKVRVKLSGDDKAVCVARASIEEGYSGSFEEEVYQRSMNETSYRRSLMKAKEGNDKDRQPAAVSRTAEARIRRSKRIANRKKWSR